MGPLDALRRTEQQIQEAARHGAEAAITTLQNVETQVRRRMHLAPRTAAKTASADLDEQRSQKVRARTGIVSVNGHDVERMRCTGGRKIS
jgi:hypothetical protein